MSDIKTDEKKMRVERALLERNLTRTERNLKLAERKVEKLRRQRIELRKRLAEHNRQIADAGYNAEELMVPFRKFNI